MNTPAAHLVLGLALLLPLSAGADEEDPPPMLLGICETSDLQEEPYSEWFQERYDEYEIPSDLVTELASLTGEELSVDIFFGTWCGDSKREVPRWLRMMEDLDWSKNNIRLIAVDRKDEDYKRSPGGETKGMHIFRVPTFVIRKSGNEIGRIVEYPALSLERDLLAILSGEEYQHNYRSYAFVQRWEAEGLLEDENVSARGLAAQIRPYVHSTSELGAAAKSYRTGGETTKALKLAQINRALHPRDARAYAYLSQAYLADGQEEKALDAAERALKLNEDPDNVEDLAGLMKDALGIEEEDDN